MPSLPEETLRLSSQLLVVSSSQPLLPVCLLLPNSSTSFCAASFATAGVPLLIVLPTFKIYHQKMGSYARGTLRVLPSDTGSFFGSVSSRTPFFIVPVTFEDDTLSGMETK